MKAITLHQPWASLLVHGHKRYETRHWMPGYFGEIAIHAGKKWDAELEAITLRFMRDFPETREILNLESLPMGAVLGICDLTGFYRTDNHRDRLGAKELAFGNFADRRWAWRMESLVVFQRPIPARGQQGIWDWIREEPEAPPQPTYKQLKLF